MRTEQHTHTHTRKPKDMGTKDTHTHTHTHTRKPKDMGTKDMSTGIRARLLNTRQCPVLSDGCRERHKSEGKHTSQDKHTSEGCLERHKHSQDCAIRVLHWQALMGSKRESCRESYKRELCRESYKRELCRERYGKRSLC